MAIYGYTRVSSKSQLENTSLKEQRTQILETYPNALIIEEQFTGKTTDRPEFTKLIKKLKNGDRLVVAKLDRFCRNVREGLTCLEELQAKGIVVHILNMGTLDDTPMGKMILTQLLAFAEFERALIVERTRLGKERAKEKNGFKDGRPKKFTKEQIKLALDLKETHSYKQVTDMTGISKSTLIRAKRKYKSN